jgi:squalene synthase HpnC
MRQPAESRYLPPIDFVGRFGTDGPAWKLDESSAYTRWLATHHYENFHVASFLLPKHLHQHFFNVYAFCRWADDLGDETGDRARSLELLAWWRLGVERMYAGECTHPVFVALGETVAEHRLPRQLFLDLIHAFEQDQRVSGYGTFDELLGYCRYSANPVGRLVLRLWGYADAERDRLSDATCTALQLTNFWQDVARDADIKRVYIPSRVMESHGYSEQSLRRDLAQCVASTEFKAVLRDLVERTHELFAVGLPLIGRVERRLAVDLELFSGGGLAVLKKIEKQDYDTIRRRPKLGKGDRAALMTKALCRMVLRGARSGSEAQHAFR